MVQLALHDHQLSDADLARLFQVTPAYIAKMRNQRGWLPQREKVGGATGRRGAPRYSFLDAVAAEVARISSSEFGWPPEVLRRVVELVGSGDSARVRAFEVLVVEGTTPATVRHVFHDPEAGATGFERDGYVESSDGKRMRVLSRASLLDIVETTANALRSRMTELGFTFSTDPVPDGSSVPTAGDR